MVIKIFLIENSALAALCEKLEEEKKWFMYWLKLWDKPQTEVSHANQATSGFKVFKASINYDFSSLGYPESIDKSVFTIDNVKNCIAQAVINIRV